MNLTSIELDNLAQRERIMERSHRQDLKAMAVQVQRVHDFVRSAHVNQYNFNGLNKCSKSLNSKTDISIFINLRYLRLKLLKNKETK